ncbi:DNA primase [Croceiramulus getboli]|nr:DNA primase [Flavobacteriaceae bacterium YJPT1-3]
MIAKHTIDQVFETARVEEVIGDFVQLKKSGSNFKGLSPFSDERTPSFMVSPVKQIWKDFSSGKGGNVVAFLMEHEHFTYPEAIKYLAKKYGIEIEETEQTDEQKQEADKRESLYLINEFAKEYYHDTLLNSQMGKAIGLTYFKERGFSMETIKKFSLGYNPDQWDAFTQAALKKGYKLDLLEETGLTIVKEERKFDRFKGRVMFPIQSMSGRVLGFGGRILTNDKKAAKYLNSPQSDIYDKSKVLYGIYFAKQAIAKEDNCYLVEGYTDVIQFYQTGIENVVSSSGTALTPEQIRLIHRLTNNITVLFDGDAAGQRASLRGIDLILEQGMNVRVCTFPDGEDPDSFSRKHTLTELQEYLKEEAKDFIQYKASLLVEEAQGDPIKKAETVRDMVSSVAKIPDLIKREVYIQECARIMDISEEVLFSALAQLLSKNKKQQQRQNAEAAQGKPFEVVPKESTPVEKVDKLYELERKIIELLLLYGDLEEEFEDMVFSEDEEGEIILQPVSHKAKVFEKIFLDLQEDEVEFTNADFQKLYYKLIETLNLGEGLKIENFINDLEPNQAEEVSNIVMNEDKYLLHRWDTKDIYVKQKDKAIAQHVTETILSLRKYLIHAKVEELSTAATEESNRELLKEILDYNNLKNLLGQKLGRVLS